MGAGWDGAPRKARCVAGNLVVIRCGSVGPCRLIARVLSAPENVRVVPRMERLTHPTRSDSKLAPDTQAMPTNRWLPPWGGEREAIKQLSSGAAGVTLCDWVYAARLRSLPGYCATDSFRITSQGLPNRPGHAMMMSRYRWATLSARSDRPAQGPVGTKRRALARCGAGSPFVK